MIILLTRGLASPIKLPIACNQKGPFTEGNFVINHATLAVMPKHNTMEMFFICTQKYMYSINDTLARRWTDSAVVES